MTKAFLPVCSPAPPVQPTARCVFHDGIATLDGLLAEIGGADAELFDAALDLRLRFTAQLDAAACVRQLFRVRALLGSRHYLAFYRVRCYAHRLFRIEARADGRVAWNESEFPRDGARLDEVVNTALAGLSGENGDVPAAAQVRFTFARAD